MIPYGRQDITAGRHRRRRGGAAVGLPHPGPDGAALRAGGGRVLRRCSTRSPSTAPPRRCTSPAWRSAWARATGSGPARSPSSPRPTARCTVVPRSTSSTSTRAPTTCARRRLERKLEQAEREGRLPKVVVPVHLCGQPCDMAGNSRPCQALRLQDHRRCLARHRRQISGRASRQLPLQRHHRLQLSPGQDHHHRRRWHGADQQRRGWPSAWRCCAATASPASRRR